MRRALLLLPALLLIGLTAGMGMAAADECEKGDEQCPQEYGGGCVPAGSVCCPDGTYGDPGSVCCGNAKNCWEGYMCGAPDECIADDIEARLLRPRAVLRGRFPVHHGDAVRCPAAGQQGAVRRHCFASRSPVYQRDSIIRQQTPAAVGTWNGIWRSTFFLLQPTGG